MRRVYQGASLVFIAMSAFMILETRNLLYYTSRGPGPAFFPFWLGLLLGGLSLVWLVQVSVQPVEPMQEGFVPARHGVVRILSVVAAILIFSLLVNTVGFQLMMFALLLFLLTVLGRQNPVLTIVICAIGSVGLYYVFKHYLGVHLPASSIEFLSNLGL